MHQPLDVCLIVTSIIKPQTLELVVCSCSDGFLCDDMSGNAEPFDSEQWWTGHWTQAVRTVPQSIDPGPEGRVQDQEQVWQMALSSTVACSWTLGSGSRTRNRSGRCRDVPLFTWTRPAARAPVPCKHVPGPYLDVDLDVHCPCIAAAATAAGEEHSCCITGPGCSRLPLLLALAPRLPLALSLHE